MEDIYVPDAWLQQIGFKLGNPFSTREASREPEPELSKYFVSHTGFDDVMGNALQPTSSFLIAERGCGKTTTRRAIEWNCRAGRPNGLILPIPCIEFSLPLKYASNDGKVVIDYYLEVIIKEALPLLLERLVQNPNLTEEFSLGFRQKLAEFLSKYSDLVTDTGLDRWLRKVDYHSKKINSEVLRSKKYSTSDVFLRFLAEILKLASQQKNERDQLTIDQLTELVILAELTGYKAIYILVDRIDEQEPMSSNPQYAANLLESLTTNLHLLELEKTAFKFFITPTIMDMVLQQPGFRRDRLMLRHISWSEEELKTMLDRRVEVFTQGKLPSLDAVTEPKLALVPRLASIANGSPRNMMRLAEWLLYWHHARTSKEAGFLISKRDLEKAIESFIHETNASARNNEFHSGIWIDEGAYIWRDTMKLGRLPELQHKLLSHLIEKKGKICSYSSLRQVVYEESSDDSAQWASGDDRVDQMVKRIRKLVEIDSRNPEYIVKVTGKGYILEQ